MTDMIQEQLEYILNLYLDRTRDFKIPDSHINKFNKFKKEYKEDKSDFYKDVTSIETPIMNEYKKVAQKSSSADKYLSNEEIEAFISGDVLRKSLDNSEDIPILKNEIARLLESDNPIVERRFLFLLSPVFINFLYKNKKHIIGTVNGLLGKENDISFEFAYFMTLPNQHSPYWHDDYTVLRNKIIPDNKAQPLLLNCLVTLTNVTKNSSPLCFLRGTEKLVYARAALKYFDENNIEFDEELFLKAIYLTENFYTPGKEIKANLLGLIPGFSYRLFQLKTLKKPFSMFFKELSCGNFLVFSPHYLHTSAYINQDKIAKESIVFRFMSNDHYNFRNKSTCKKLLEYLSIAKGRKLDFEEIKNTIFKNFPNIKLDSEILLNIYINKNFSTVNNQSTPKIYLEDLWKFFQNN